MRKLSYCIPLVLLASAAAFAFFAHGSARAEAFRGDRVFAQTPQPQPSPLVVSPPPSPNQAVASAAPGVTVVIDPAHGGGDTGARGPSGVNEKDLVLSLARAVRSQLTQQGYRVVMTRDSDTDPSYDERAGIANELPEVIFISLHVSSTGAAGTARVYYYEFSAPFTFSAASQASGVDTSSIAAQAPPAPGGLVPWRQAQRPYLDVSQRLAARLQEQFAQQFFGSPSAASPAAVRELRSVMGPAVAIEVSSVAVPNPASIAAMASPLSAAVVKGIQAFQPLQETIPGAPGDAR